jgi:hypothetical protein
MVQLKYFFPQYFDGLSFSAPSICQNTSDYLSAARKWGVGVGGWEGGGGAEGGRRIADGGRESQRQAVKQKQASKNNKVLTVHMPALSRYNNCVHFASLAHKSDICTSARSLLRLRFR